MRFVSQYWKGEIRVAPSFWWFFLLLGCAYHVLEPHVLKPFSDNPKTFITATVLYLVVTRLLIFPWQIVGLLRSTNAHYLQFGRRTILYSVQGCILASIVGTASHVITVAQTLFFYKKNIDFYATEKIQPYTIDLVEGGQQLILRGVLDFGVSNDVRALLEKNPEISSIVLESDGGQIYEGRGLSIAISNHALDVYSYEKCFSACTTAFIGGRKRFLGEAAKLGFHQYGFDPERRRELTQLHDLEAEQEKERALFQSKNIAATFIDQMFSTPSDGMWFPTKKRLIDAGVIDGVVSAPINAPTATKGEN